MSIFTLQLEVFKHRYIKGMTMLPKGTPGTRRKPWIAKILGIDDKYKYKREFLKHQEDYSHAGREMTRDVYWYFHLQPDTIYEIFIHKNWQKDERYFAVVTNGKLIKIPEENIQRWLKIT